MTSHQADIFDTDAASVILIPKLPGFIHFYTRGESEYACYENDCYVKDNSNYHNSTYLGKVIDKEDNLFYSNKLGFFHFTLEKGIVRRYDLRKDSDPECLRLRYGDLWVYEQILSKTGFDHVTQNLMLSKADFDTFNTLLAYKLTENDYAFDHAQLWFNRSYAKVMYPNAAVSSGSISSFLAKIGEERYYREFTKLYLAFLNKDELINENRCFPVLIDSTGLPNSINIDKTQVSNHSGVISNEIRLIYVVDRDSGLPIFFKLIAGNIIDNSTLKSTLSLLSANNIDVKFLIMDAGYSSINNLELLSMLGIDFVTRLSENLRCYKDLIAKHSADLANDVSKVVLYNDRFIYCQHEEVIINNKPYHAYLCIDDFKMYSDKKSAFIKNDIGYDYDVESYDKNIKNVTSQLNNFGRFVLISNTNISTKEIVETYYTRQRIEQIIDISKNNASLLPIRCHSDETIRGHLLISFIVTVLTLLLNDMLKDVKLNSFGVFMAMRSLFINIFDNTKIIDEPNSDENDIIQTLDLKSDFQIDIRQSFNPKLRAAGSKRKRGRPKGSLGKKIGYRQIEPISNEIESNIDELTGENSLDSGDRPVKRSRGRPKGSTKKSTEKRPDNTNSQVKRSRGRPKGSTKKSTEKRPDYTNSQAKRSRGRPKGSAMNNG
jgi:hypothetical protein